MNMISEQVKELREYANVSLYAREIKARELLRQAADTIEILSAKLQAANMDNGSKWIPCEDRLQRNDVTIKQVIDKLAEYENLEKQGKLLKLPCEIGHSVYMIYQFLGEGTWEIEEHKIRLEDLDKIGKTVFLTKSAAEQALKEMEGKK